MFKLSKFLLFLSLVLIFFLPHSLQACGTSGKKVDYKNRKIPYSFIDKTVQKSKPESLGDSQAANCPPSNLFLTSKPEGAKVFIDKKELPLKTPLIIETFPEGSHHVLLQYPGIPAYQFDIQVYSYAQKNYLVDLRERKILSPDEDSDAVMISFDSKPKGASLTLNNEQTQSYKTPLKLRLNKNETYDYKLELTGFKSAIGKIRQGNPSKVNVELIPMQ